MFASFDRPEYVLRDLCASESEGAAILYVVVDLEVTSP